MSHVVLDKLRVNVHVLQERSRRVPKGVEVGVPPRFMLVRDVSRLQVEPERPGHLATNGHVERLGVR
jgi:hypothetical protein